MQQLHLVGPSSDLHGLVFSVRKGARSGRFVLPVDDTLLKSIVETLQQRNGHGPPTTITAAELVTRRPERAQSGLSPREIQARLRAGRSIDDVAKEAAVDRSWVERFAVPIVAEQGIVLERVVRFAMDTARRGRSAYPLADAVRRNLTTRGVADADRLADQGWSAHEESGDVWVVRFRYRSRGREQVAEWEADLGAETLFARNRAATELGYVAKARRSSSRMTAPPPAAKRSAPKKSVAKKAAAKKSPAAKNAKKASAAKSTKKATPATRRSTTAAAAAKKRSPTRTKKAPAKASAKATKKRARS